MGVYALTAQEIWQMPKNKKVRVLLLILLVLPLLYCFNYRAWVLFRYFDKLDKRVVAAAPGIRGLWIFPTENDLFNTLHSIFASLPPEIRKRGVLNHTPDGLYSCIFPAPAGFRHPMFVNWKDDVYPDYNEAVLKFLEKTRVPVLTTAFTEIPGYIQIYGFKHFEKEFRFFVPEY